MMASAAVCALFAVDTRTAKFCRFDALNKPAKVPEFRLKERRYCIQMKFVIFGNDRDRG